MKFFQHLRNPGINRADYKNFTEPKEASDWGATHYGDWSIAYSNDEPNRVKNSVGIYAKNPIECYCGNVYRDINPPLWNDMEFRDDQLLEMDAALHSIIQNAPRIPEPIVVYRLEGSRTVELLDNALRRHENLAYKSYMSTSLLASIANRTGANYGDRRALMRLYLPAGTAGIYVDKICNREEYEVVFQKGRVLRVLERHRHQIIGYRHDNRTGKDVSVIKDLYDCAIVG
jgi:hypothetical protein